ncbi:SprT-like domain-containing protein [Verrucomicrobiales bacterium]|jgi:SprT protein|nr:SprT-like domain-containing protein [Verrucomicrobiales bacterium]|tara:strand:+ start:261 stop:908 length:648 start_codon:yes stop_codon:yes gene_type:complete
MSDQLELFGDDTFGSDNPDQPDDSPTEAPKNRASVPDGYVKVKIGRDGYLTAQAVEHAERLGLKKLAGQVVVVWNRRMRTAAGRAFYQTNRIELNPKLQALPGAESEKEVEGTFLHELAHLVAYNRNLGKRIQPHGDEWKQACADLGIPGEDRCHSLDFQPRSMKRNFAYVCIHCGTVVERVRKFKRTVACYACCKAYTKGKFDMRFVLKEKPKE